jgi:small basic protein
MAASLFTHEDSYHIHKTLGAISLLHFLYRYGSFFLYGTFGFGDGWLTAACLGCHQLLSTSSFIFKVIKHRMLKNPLIIYKEYQLHAILFTTRATLPYLLYKMDAMYYYTHGILLCHMFVDVVTLNYGTPGVTAVRVRGNTKRVEIRALRYFFSFYQVVALASLLGGKDSVAMGFNTLGAIQSSAFLMTLRRKNIVGWTTYAFWYSVALLASYAYIYHIYGWRIYIAALLVFGGRILKINKYLLWTGFWCSTFI